MAKKKWQTLGGNDGSDGSHHASGNASEPASDGRHVGVDSGTVGRESADTRIADTGSAIDGGRSDIDSGAGIGSSASGDGSSGSGGSGRSGSGDHRDDGTDASGDGRTRNGDDAVGTGHPGQFTVYGEPIVSASGRHKRKQCPCEKCTNWRFANGVAVQVDTESATDPVTVPYEAVTGRTRNFAKNAVREMLGIGVSFLYDIPTMIAPAGTADHWPLRDGEERSLVERLEAVSEMLPKKTRTKGLEFLARIVPPIALVATAWIITKPRIDLTRELIAQRKTRHPLNPNNANPSAPTQPPNQPGPALVRDDTGSEPRTNNDAGSGHVVRDDSVAGLGSSERITRDNSALSDVAARF